jgi:tetraacyldisaccharide 4'-kinase
MTEWTIRKLKHKYKIATLSRGYKRRTKGFCIANEQTTALEIGDEPMQFYQKFPEITVAVGEERIVAIPQILYQRPDTGLIILDDAMQHRSVSAGYNIMLTEYSNLFTRDFVFPCGDLRDIKSSAKRANTIIVTKCPADLSQEESIALKNEISNIESQTIYFATIKYGIPYHITTLEERNLMKTDQVLLVCGIANPEPIKRYLSMNVSIYEMLKFKDHHIFTTTDLKEIQNNYNKLDTGGETPIILTTEKDAVRLNKFKEELRHLPIFVLPVEHEILFEQENKLLTQIDTFVQSFNKADNPR